MEDFSPASAHARQPEEADVPKKAQDKDGLRERNQQQTDTILRTDEGREPAPARRADHEAKLAGAVPDDLRAQIAKARTGLVSYLADGMGAGGRRTFRPSSDGRKALREETKQKAREVANDEIDQELANKDELAEKPASRRFYEIGAKSRAYRKAKQSVDAAVTSTAEDWVDEAWQSDALAQQAAVVARDAAWDILRADPDNRKALSRALKAGREAAKQFIAEEARHAHEVVRERKNAFVKPKDDQGEATAPDQAATQDKQQLVDNVGAKTQADQVGKKSLDTVIRAQTTEEGLGLIGKLMDQVVPMAGDQVGFNIQLQIPCDPSGVAYVMLALSGSAARGMDGAMTAGIPIFGNPDRLELMGQFRIGAGAETLGVKGDLSLGFFVRGGADSTGDCMKAISYGAYRAATGINKKLGNWWAVGTNKGTKGISGAERAETWASMVEEQVFAGKKNDQGEYEGSNAYAHIGASGDATASGDVGVASLSGAAGLKAFKKYDAASMKESLGNDRFAKPVAGGNSQEREQAAKERQGDAKGGIGGSYGASAAATVGILGQSVTFGANVSGALGAGWKDNWGVEINASMSFALGGVPGWQEKLTRGILHGALSASQNVAALVAKDRPEGTSVDMAADLARIADAGLGDQLSTQLGNLSGLTGDLLSLGGSSGLQVAIMFGKGDGKGIFRFELRETKSLSVAIGQGTAAGLSVDISKTKRLAAIGYDEGKFNAELLGVRARPSGGGDNGGGA